MNSLQVRAEPLVARKGRRSDPCHDIHAACRLVEEKLAPEMRRPPLPLGEEVAACVVAAPDITETDLLKFCRVALSSWQVPKRIFIVDAIPANERGKISRRELSRRFSTSRERSSLP